MRVSLRWLNEYVAISDLAPTRIAEVLTDCGLEVEQVDELGAHLAHVVVGQIVAIERHPDADKLNVCQVDVGQPERLQIVCGAPNAALHLKAPVALVGAVLPGDFRIKKAKLRGVESSGMLCSARELAIGEGHEGLMALPEDAPVGQAMADFLGLNDTVIELSVTPNRSDCLSIAGVARDLAAALGRPFCDPWVEGDRPAVAAATGRFSVEVRATDACSVYSALFVPAVRTGESPPWLQQMLAAIEQRSISNVVDVTNWILMSVGQPMHAFDADKLSGDRLIVDWATSGERFVGLDGIERTLDGSELTIRDASGPVALAGVIGGLHSSVDETTTSIVFESARFSPHAVRRTIKAHGVRTDSSYRFERSVDPATSTHALTLAWRMLQRLGCIDSTALEPGAAAVAAGGAANLDAPEEIVLPLDMPRRFLGVEIEQADALNTFSRLGLSARVESGAYRVAYCSRRPDLTRAIDLVEELGRIRGLDDIPSLLPPGTVGARHTARASSAQRFQPIMADTTIARQRRLKDYLVGAGLSEAVTIALVDAARNADFGEVQTPVVVNAMTSTMASLRGSLMPGLLRSAGLNLAAGNARVSLFELGTVFNEVPAVSDGPEPVNVAAVFAGVRAGGLFHHGAALVDGWDATGVLAGAGRVIGAGLEIRRDSVERSWLMPGESASVYAASVLVGWVGQLHPDVLDPLEIEDPVYAFEFRVSDLLQADLAPVQARAVPRKTPSYRDVALVVERGLAWSTVDAAIRARRPAELEHWEVFDLYTGDRIADGLMSLGVRLTYRPTDAGYTDEQLAAIHDALVNHVLQATGAQRRA